MILCTFFFLFFCFFGERFGEIFLFLFCKLPGFYSISRSAHVVSFLQSLHFTRLVNHIFLLGQVTNSMQLLLTW